MDTDHVTVWKLQLGVRSDTHTHTHTHRQTHTHVTASHYRQNLINLQHSTVTPYSLSREHNTHTHAHSHAHTQPDRQIRTGSFLTSFGGGLRQIFWPKWAPCLDSCHREKAELSYLHTHHTHTHTHYTHTTVCLPLPARLCWFSLSGLPSLSPGLSTDTTLSSSYRQELGTDRASVLTPPPAPDRASVLTPPPAPATDRASVLTPPPAPDSQEPWHHLGERTEADGRVVLVGRLAQTQQEYSPSSSSSNRVSLNRLGHCRP